MLIAFFSNYINHHQVLVADELYKLTNGNYYFIETIPLPEFRKKLGYSDYSTRKYIIQAWNDDDSYKKAEKICLDADVALFGSVTVHNFQIQRAKARKLSFEVNERWLKRGLLNILSPRLLRNIFAYHTIFRKAPMYKLCCSAFTANDQYLMLSYKDKCFKWGYFTQVDNNYEKQLLNPKYDSSLFNTPKIMWCSRFLKLKHPELPIKMAARLKKNGYNFVLNMYGSGHEEEDMKKLTYKLGVDDVVKFLGVLPNKDILEAMREHDIFLFTSDKREGWGAVANEAMSNGCVLVGSDAIGSIPFLVKDLENGCIFKSCNVESLTEKVTWLIDNPIERQKIALNGYRTMRDIWSPENAAKNLLQLIDDILNGRKSSISDGPCSKALPI